ncbi:DUF177 domain-containing protein [Erythrobacter sp. SD-21]|uniref:YceD family protein n=1 Tax=Erythrobacter sp. SD-21 TaxID=161528 RepID=UPI0001540890|nr:DUF177 domain-containing protein [Erythrobacter sp. SD-21]EDL47731.1 hypothetical protein ED21_23458 [Erythrobacter sp. SD-21]
MSDGNELVRLVKPRALPAGSLKIDTTAQERAALAKRFGVIAIEALTAKVDFAQKEDAVLVVGTFRATVEQPCAVTRDPLTYEVSEPFSLNFVPAGLLGDYEEDQEFELTAEDLDQIEYEGDVFDLGEAIAQELALAIDPYREGPEADALRAETGIESDETRTPSGPLAEAMAALTKK